MKNRKSDNVKTMSILIPVILIARIVPGIPWWTFVIPVIFTGILVTAIQWRIASLAIGFLSGFVIWVGANLYFDIIFNGLILAKMGHTFSVPKIVVMLISGVIGGLLTGLALYTGKALVFQRNTGLAA